MPSLYIVATPIGNLEDITLRALRVLREVGLIAAEDTRVTRKLLNRYDITTSLTSYHEHNKLSKLPAMLNTLAEKDVALVSDAGMPGINDPGYELVCAAVDAGVRVVPIPGASAVTSAIAVSGLPIDRWTYLGFLPRKRAERRRLLESLASEKSTLVIFETPHRLKAALSDILDAWGDRRIAVCRELTKLHEEIFRGVVSEALAHFDSPRGEFTLVIEGGAESIPDESQQEAEAIEMLSRLRRDGVSAKDAVAQVAQQFEMPRRKAYRLWLDMKSSEDGQSTSTE